MKQGQPGLRITQGLPEQSGGPDGRPGPELITQLLHSLPIGQTGEAASGKIPEFDLSGLAFMAGCDRPGKVAFSVRDKAACFFGDIDPQPDIGDLVAFANQYREPLDGWFNSGTRPGKPRGAGRQFLCLACEAARNGGAAMGGQL